MKPISRFLCRYISVEFPVRLSTDDRRSYRVTSRWTHQASRLMIPEDQYSDMVPPPVLTSRDRTALVMFLTSRLDPADPLLHVSCHVGGLSFALSSFSACCCCFSCCWRLKWFLVWLMIWLPGQHTQLICIRTSVCCQPGSAGLSGSARCVPLSAAVTKVDVCPLICVWGRRKVPAFN